MLSASSTAHAHGPGGGSTRAWRWALTAGLSLFLIAALNGKSLADVPPDATPPTPRLSDSSTGKNGAKLKWLPPRPQQADDHVDRAVVQAQCAVPANVPSGPMQSVGPQSEMPADVVVGPMRPGLRHPLRTAARPIARAVETTTRALRNQFGDKRVMPAPAEPIIGALQPAPSATTLGEAAPSGPALEQPLPAGPKGAGRLPVLPPVLPGEVPAAPPPSQAEEPGLSPPPYLPPTETRSKKSEVRQPLLEQETIAREHQLKETCPSPKDLKKIGQLTTNLTPEAGDLPQDCPLGNDVFQGRCWCPTTFAWTASSLCHKPLYFDDTSLEVYGHMWGPWVQPILSGARFFGTFFILPYEMGLELPGECIYALGDYRPGDCAPYQLDPLPLSIRAALFEAGAWTGGAILFH